MTQEQLKSLRLEDFQAPNKVLCYGGGEAFKRIAPSMINCGINVVGVIDANKQGAVFTGGMQLPYLSIEQASKVLGTDTIIIITIADEKIFLQVRQTLLEYGFSEERIFDLNVWTWLTVPSENSYCDIMYSQMQFYAPAFTKCCRPGIDEPFFCEWFVKGRPPEQSVNNFLAKHQYYIEQSKEGRVPLYCKGCDCLMPNLDKSRTGGIQFIFSDHTFCNADCVYCEYACTVSRKETGVTIQKRHTAMLKMLEQVQGLLNDRSVIRLEGGEITIDPYRDEIFERIKSIVNQYPKLQIQVLSNCFIFDQRIAEFLLLNQSSYISCDLDAGTPETYIKVKGFNRFGVVCENLKKYAQYGTVKLKYIILPGWNDSQADYEGTVAILKGLRLNELMLSPEFGASREGDRAKIREVLFSTARFMALLEDNGIQAVLPEPFWKKENMVVVKRLYQELRDYYNTSPASKNRIG